MTGGSSKMLILRSCNLENSAQLVDCGGWSIYHIPIVFFMAGYIYIYLDSPTTLNFWGLSRKMAFFSESTFFEIKYCFLHVSDVHSWRYS